MNTPSKHKTRRDILLGYGALILLCLYLFALGIMSLGDNTLLGWMLLVGGLAGVFVSVAKAGSEFDALPPTTGQPRVDQSQEGQTALGISASEPGRSPDLEANTARGYSNEIDPWLDISAISPDDNEPENPPTRRNSVAGCCGCLLILAILGTFIPLFSPFTSALVAAWSALFGGF